MSRIRVVRECDDGFAFGYEAPPEIDVIADWLDIAQAKAIFRHFTGKRAIQKLAAEHRWYELDNVTYHVEVLYDGEWHNVTQDWSYREQEGLELWCQRKGLMYI